VESESTTPDQTGGADVTVRRRIAYLSMEVGIDSRLPVYAGGLGVLAGDVLRTFADLEMGAVGVTLLYREGYFRQTVDEAGQHEHPVSWDPAAVLRLLPAKIEVLVEGRPVAIRAWQYDVVGLTGFRIPLLLLDSEVDGNTPSDRQLTARLYGGDDRYRLAQEIVLGIGGAKMLEALGYTAIERYHLNEGHASLLAVELLCEEPDQAAVAQDIADVKARCVFTTHTPVPAGHDRFSYELVKEVLGEPLPIAELKALGGADRLNMTLLGLNLSHYVNGVAKRHGIVSQHLFPGYAIDSITNGVHSVTWTADPFRRLFDRHIPGWRRDPFSLRYAMKIPPDDIWAAHLEAKQLLLERVRDQTGRELAVDSFTIGFARRMTMYKRPDLAFHDCERLANIARTAGRLQLVIAGKAHPQDEPGKDLVRQLVRIGHELDGKVPVVFLEDYDLVSAGLLTSGVDLWLNTPLRPLEASGTSGMKAAHNGVPSLSILDGWWTEGHLEGITGWSIGEEQASDEPESPEERERDAGDLYDKLGGVVVPLFYDRRAEWTEVMQQCIAINGSFFNSHRMVQQYAAHAYM
jgi:starch phosphorylase